MLRMLILVMLQALLLGHEGIGKVIEVAEDVESLKLETVCLSLGCSKAVEDVNIVQQVVKHFAVV